MTWIEPVSTAVTAASLASEVAQTTPAIRKFAKRLLFKIRHGQVSIPIFGAGGVGKSTASRILAGADPLDISAAYDESWVIEPVKLTGDVPGKLIAAPGQIERADRHWPELFQKILTGEAPGLVNVVSWGYHSLAIHSFTEHCCGQVIPDTLLSDFFKVQRRSVTQRRM